MSVSVLIPHAMRNSALDAAVVPGLPSSEILMVVFGKPSPHSRHKAGLAPSKNRHD